MKGTVETLEQQLEQYRSKGLALDLTRGQPSDPQFDLSNALVRALQGEDFVSQDGFDVRNYPGGLQGLRELREIFAPSLDVSPDQMILGENSSLALMGRTIMWAALKGVPGGDAPWGTTVKFLCPVPGYDRHFTLLQKLGIEMISVPLLEDGPDMDRVEDIVRNDPSVKGIWIVPKYSNPTGITYSEQSIRRLASMETAAPDFRVFADNAYAIHNISFPGDDLVPLLRTFEEEGNPDRVYIFGSSSKVTFAGSGVGYVAASQANIAHLLDCFGSQTIGPDKVNQLAHARFLSSYPGGLEGLMKAHAEELRPRLEAVLQTLEQEFGSNGECSWTKPRGGYFVSVDVVPGTAKRVIELAARAGVKLTAAGATFPYGVDPEDKNIRFAFSRPPVDDVRAGVEVFCLCVKLAAAEKRN